ncbi:hypothetical protein Q5752_002341 [Cryptotrichosporon argae]
MKLAFLVALAAPAAAHIALFNNALFGLNWPNAGTTSLDQNWNNNAIVSPLRGNDNLTTAQWFAHGAKNMTPVAGEYMWLPSGGKYVGELSCNRGYTSYRRPDVTGALMYYACTDTNPLHNANKFGQPLNVSLFGGTALAIAYTSDVNALKPSDMTVISINYTSPWQRETIYQIPAGLPACPANGCLCTWNWIHQQNHKEGYGQEIYNTLYRCKVNGTTNNSNKVGPPKPANYCANNKANCTTGPKQPMYVWQVDGNNMVGRMGPDYPTVNPTYNLRFGWADGAQSDAIVSGSSTSKAPASASAHPSAAVLAAAIAGLTSLSGLASTLAAATASASASDMGDDELDADPTGTAEAGDALASATSTGAGASHTPWAHPSHSHAGTWDRRAESGASATLSDTSPAATTTMPGGQVCMRVPRQRDEL